MNSNSEIISATVIGVDIKQGISKKGNDYHASIVSAVIAEDSGFKSSLPVSYTQFTNKGETPPLFKAGDKIRISIDALEIDKRTIKVTRGVLL